MAKKRKYINVDTKEERYFTDETYNNMPRLHGQEKSGWIPAEEGYSVEATPETPPEAVKAQKKGLKRKLQDMEKEEVVEFGDKAGIELDRRKSKDNLIAEILEKKFNG